MTTKQNFKDFSALDAQEHLLNALHYFFSDQRHRYQHSKALRHYTALCDKNEFATSKTLFKIITGTNLVTNQTVTSHKTTQGQRYFIRNDFFQQVQRHQRLSNRNNNISTNTTRTTTQKTPPVSTKSTASPFLQLQDLQDTSDEEEEDETKTDSLTKQFPKLLTDTNNTPKMKNTPDVSNNDDSINTTVTDHAAELEKDMDNALEELKSDSENNGNDFNRTDLTQMIKDIVHEELASTKQMLDI